MFHVEHRADLAEFMRGGAPALGISLAEEHISMLFNYMYELKKWNDKINLTSIIEDKDIVVKHFLDSLFCARAISLSQGCSILDIGAGAGFPGLPLKIVNRNVELTLLEPNQKKVAFLDCIIGTLGLHNTVAIPERIERFRENEKYSGPFSYIVTRALKLADILPYLRSILDCEGAVILCRSSPIDQSIGDSGLRISQEIPYVLPFGYGQRVLTVLAPS